MLSRLFETGHPWITFKDPCNIRSPQDHVGVVHSSNLCTEITLNTSAEETAVCNLGSINLARHVVDGKLDEEIIAQTVAVAVRMLDNVIDINFYPVKEAQTSNMRHRPIGLGMMGFQDALYQVGYYILRLRRHSSLLMKLWSLFHIMRFWHHRNWQKNVEHMHHTKVQSGIVIFFPQDTIDLLEQERGMCD